MVSDDAFAIARLDDREDYGQRRFVIFGMQDQYFKKNSSTDVH